MSVPLTAAQATASPRPTSGSAGLAGGFFPVVARHVVVRARFARAAAPSAATSENAEKALLPSSDAMALTVPTSAGPPGDRCGSAGAGRLERLDELVRSPARHEPVR